MKPNLIGQYETRREEEKKLNYYERKDLQGGITGTKNHQKRKATRETKQNILKSQTSIIKAKLVPTENRVIYAISLSSRQPSCQPSA